MTRARTPKEDSMCNLRIVGNTDHKDHYDEGDPDRSSWPAGTTARSHKDHYDPKIPHYLVGDGGTLVSFALNGEGVSIQSIGDLQGGVNMFLRGDPGDRLSVGVENHSRIPHLAIVSLNGLCVATGRPASRDDAGVLVLPGTKCEIARWFDGSPLTLFGVPRRHQPEHVPNMGILGVVTYAVDNRGSTATGSLGTLSDLLRALGRHETMPWTKREGVWRTLATGMAVPADLLPRTYPPGHEVAIRYDTQENLLRRGIDLNGIPTTREEAIEPWWRTSAFPGDDRPYGGGKPKAPVSAESADRTNGREADRGESTSDISVALANLLRSSMAN